MGLGQLRMLKIFPQNAFIKLLPTILFTFPTMLVLCSNLYNIALALYVLCCICISTSTYYANHYASMFDAGLYVVIVNNSINFQF